MIQLEDWFSRNARLPIVFALGVFLCLQLAYFGQLSYKDYSRVLTGVERMVETASIGAQQANRPLIEATLISGLQSLDATAVALCDGARKGLVYPPTGGRPCSASGKGLTRWVVRKPLIGVSDQELVVVLSPLSQFGPILMVAVLTAVPLMLVVAIVLRAGRRFESEILNPLYSGLTSSKTLGITELDRLRKRNRKYVEVQRQRADEKARVDLSARIAHDIRSPVEVLLGAIRAGDREVIRSAGERIRGIADHLLDRYRNRNSAGPTVTRGIPEQTAPSLLRPLIADIIAEKRVEFCERNGIRLSSECARGASDVRVEVEPEAFQRVLSNVINNAVEALGERGSVSVSQVRDEKGVEIRVADTGRGIPEAVLPQLGRRRFSFGKNAGTGLGLHYAKREVAAWGGRLNIQSEEGRGTTVSLCLPIADAPGRVVLVDDDDLVRLAWEKSAGALKVPFTAFPDAASLLEALDELPATTTFYLDVEMADGSSGRDIARSLRDRGFSNLILSTGHAANTLELPSWITGIVGKEPPWVTASL